MSYALSSQLHSLLERPEAKKARRIGFHVVRAAKKFLVGTGQAAWVVRERRRGSGGPRVSTCSGLSSGSLGPGRR